MFSGTKLKGGSTVEELLSTNVPALCKGQQISVGVREYASQHPHENHITVFELQPGRDYQQPEGATVHCLESTSLKGAGRSRFREDGGIWQPGH